MSLFPKRHVLGALGFVLGAWSFLFPFVGLSQTPASDLANVSIEDLMHIEVTSVSRKEQKLSKAAAAVYVISQEDIRRSGAINIPDLLRMVPGVHVAQLDANIWVISIRGFSDRFGDKVLVLIDGRSVYTPTSSGVYWDQQDLPLEDIERIEVIRGPGGTAWGANAVNGVINIITKSARATQGGLVRANAGSETAQGLVQYGGKISKHGAYRVFGDYSNTDNLQFDDRSRAADGWHMAHTGIRSDWDLSPRDTMTVQGDVLGTREGETVDVVLADALPREAVFDSRIRMGEGDVLARWNRTFSSHSDTSLQAYYDDYDRHEQGGLESRRTFDLDFQHHLAVGSRNDVVWGLGYRVTRDNLTPKYSKSFVPAQRTDNLFTTFVQDEIRVANSLWFTLGSKLEHNAYTGLEFEPSAQLLWTPTDRQAVWVSVARAIRQPARADTAIRIDVATFPLEDGGFGVKQIQGTPDREAETLLSYQIGYRAEVNNRLSFDVATFRNSYHHLQTDEPGIPFFTDAPAPPHEVLPVISDDKAHALTYGAEVFADWNVTSHWRIAPGYAFNHMNVAPDPTSQDDSVSGISGDSPRHTFEVRSMWSLPHHLDWDVSMYRVGSLPDQEVAAYNRVDTRVSWRLGESAEFRIMGQNLLTPRHAEFGDDTPLHTLVKRSVYGAIQWRF